MQRTDIFGKPSKSKHTFLFLYKGDLTTCLYLSENSLNVGVQRQKCTLLQFGNILVNINKKTQLSGWNIEKRNWFLLIYFVSCLSSIDQQGGLVLCVPKNSLYACDFMDYCHMHNLWNDYARNIKYSYFKKTPGSDCYPPAGPTEHPVPRWPLVAGVVWQPLPQWHLSGVCGYLGQEWARGGKWMGCVVPAPQCKGGSQRLARPPGLAQCLTGKVITSGNLGMSFGLWSNCCCDSEAQPGSMWTWVISTAITASINRIHLTIY